MDGVPPIGQCGSLGPKCRQGDLFVALGRDLIDPRSGELHHNDFEHAESRAVDAPASLVLLVGLDHSGFVAAVLARTGRRDHDAVDGSELQHKFL